MERAAIDSGGPLPVCLRGGRQGLFGLHGYEGVNIAVPGPDQVKRLLDERGRADIPST